MSARCSSTARLRSRWFSGSIGSAGWFGNVPSSSMYRGTSVTGRRSNTGGTTRPPMPFAVSAATVSGRIAETSTNDSTCSTYASSSSSPSHGPRGRPGDEPVPFGQVADLAEAGVLPDRFRAGEAELQPVVVRGVVAGREHDARDAHASRTRSTAGRWRRARGRRRRSLGDVTPSLERRGERRGREPAVPPERDVLGPPDHSANAAPIERATSSSSSSGTTPRTSYALKRRPRSRCGDTVTASY